MPNVIEDLVIDRVDLVDEGANSAAFIEVFKRKESTSLMEITEILSKMKPEHAAVVQQSLDEVAKLRDDLAKANETVSSQTEQLTKLQDDLAKRSKKQCSCGGTINEKGICEECGKAAGFDEAEVLKGMPEPAKEAFLKMRAQKEAAEAQVLKAAEEKRSAEALAKAIELKALPVEQDKLVEVLKSADKNVVDILTTVASAIDSTVLTEVGKSATNGAAAAQSDAWAKIEAEAVKVAGRDSITKQKAIGVVIKEQPDLYREYLNGGAE